jgi:hypothetical protein
VIAVCVVVAGVAGYIASTLVGGKGSPSGATAPAVAAAGGGSSQGAASAKGTLGAIAARNLPDLRCSITAAAAGGPTLEHATCTPIKAGSPAITRVALTSFADKAGLDRFYANALALVNDPAARRPADCRPDLAWGGRGRWFRDTDLTVPGGRMFCFTAGQPTIVWTVNGVLILAQAAASSSSELGAWWARERLLMAAGEPSSP